MKPILNIHYDLIVTLILGQSNPKISMRINNKVFK